MLRIRGKLKRTLLLVIIVFILFLQEFSVYSYPRQKCEINRNQFERDVWLKGESAPVAFGSQLFAIYSFVPVAFIFKTHLILGDIYSRKHANQLAHAHSNNHLIIEKTVKHRQLLGGGAQKAVPAGRDRDSGSVKSVLTALPFGAFFDVKHFIHYWSLHNLKVVTLYDYEHCLNISHKITKVKRIPDFSPIQKSGYGSLLHQSQVKFPIANNQTIAIDSPHKFVALYWFWNDLTMLKYVHTSLKPAPAIERVVKAVLKELPPGFIAMHVRLDSDVFSNTNITIQQHKKALIAHIMSSTCLTEIAKFDNSFIDPPAIYLVTNTMFHSGGGSGGHHHHHHGGSGRKHRVVGASLSTASSGHFDERIRFLTNELSIMGFHVIHTKTTVMERLTLNLLEKAFEFKEIGDPTLIRRLLPEQLAYVDMLISRASSCFIPSHVPSTFSYLIQRMRKLDKNQVEQFEEINNATYGSLSMYRQWGM